MTFGLGRIAQQVKFAKGKAPRKQPINSLSKVKFASLEGTFPL